MGDEWHQQGGEPAQPEGSVARAINKSRRGEASELAKMMVVYFDQLLARARKGLANTSRADDEGAVQSAMRSCWRVLTKEEGRKYDLKHRSELEGLLFTILRRKVAHQIRDLATKTAGSGNVFNEPETGLDDVQRLASLCQRSEPSPMDAAIEREDLQKLDTSINSLREYMADRRLLEVADLVLEGRSYREIAGRLRITEAKARRSITLVRNRVREVFGLEEDAEG